MNKVAKLINSKSILDCENDNEITKHTDEMYKTIDNIVKYDNYECALLCKYQDEYHKKEEMKIYSCCLNDIFSELERFDMKNGIDMHIDEDGFINFIIYGQSYGLNEKYYLITMAVKVLPYNKNKEFLDVSNTIKNNEKPKISKNQFESIFH